MYKFLINLKQCLKFDIQICNDLTGPNRNLVIEASQDLFITIAMYGSTCGIIMCDSMHLTVYGELYDCQ